MCRPVFVRPEGTTPLFVLGALLAWLVVGCAGPAVSSPSDGGLPCVDDSTCPTGMTCQRGLCTPTNADAGMAVDGGTAGDGGVSDDGGNTSDGGPSEDGGSALDGGTDAGALAGFGQPCVDNETCSSGICIQSSLGSVCTKFCSEDCPIDWGCKIVQIGPNRTASVCFPGADIYCLPCTTNDCASPGDLCTQIDSARYCTRDCTTTGQCPTGFECLAVSQDGAGQWVAPAASTPDGGVADAGVADAGVGDGGMEGADGGAGSTDAGGAPDAGATPRQCIPVGRLCPGCIDGDRDGYGVGADCLGPDCDDGNADIHPGAAEICDGVDNNCDGRRDELFDLSTNNDHCGACNQRCNTAQGFQCCNGQCVQPSNDANNCGGCGNPTTGANICAAGQSCCSGNCSNTDTDLANCGGCSTTTTPRACLTDGSQLCCSGSCRDIRVDDAHCGGCGDSATGNHICKVVFGERCCEGTCANILSDSAHCGGCKGVPRQCTAGTEACCNGVCTGVIGNDLACGSCANNCTTTSGGNCCGTSCFDKLNDVQHCGDSCISCTGSQPACCGGDCADLESDPRHCGSCNGPNSNCPTGSSCCGGACANLAEDETNCGTCGRRCALGQTCCGGQCLNLGSDPNNCGSTCGNRVVCGGAAGVCCDGSCINTQSDDNNCGACRNVCNTGIGQRCCSAQCKNLQQGDVNNCGACGQVCDLPNTATHTCSSGTCRVSACDAGWYNIDTSQTNGCECQQGSYEPNNSSASAEDLGSFTDGGSQGSVITRLVPWSSGGAQDVDWFKFRGVDDTDLGSDSFRIRVTVSGLPTQNSYRLTVYRGLPPGQTGIGGDLCCCGFLCLGTCSMPASLSATSNGASSMTVDGWEDPSGLGGGCDNTHDYYVRIEQISGSGVCASLTVTIRNG